MNRVARDELKRQIPRLDDQRHTFAGCGARNSSSLPETRSPEFLPYPNPLQAR